MTIEALPDGLVDKGAGGGRILLIVMDGIGGLPHPETGLTELEAAHTPNLDELAAESSLGMLLPVGYGVTPGSGPGHLSLFGYDPMKYQIGRGVLAALGVGFGLERGDVAVRLNLATLDAEGRVLDRRAGRPSDADGARVVSTIGEAFAPPDGVQLFIDHVKEHRAVLVLRGEGLVADLADTDPQETGVPPHPVRARTPSSEPTAQIVRGVLSDIQASLVGDPVANGVYL